MGYKALITLDLTNTDEMKREKFYNFLTEKKWVKIENITTAWKTSFIDNTYRSEAISILKKDIRKAKEISGVYSVNFAIQVGKGIIEIDN
jgi:hypothetical protein